MYTRDDCINILKFSENYFTHPTDADLNRFLQSNWNNTSSLFFNVGGKIDEKKIYR